MKRQIVLFVAVFFTLAMSAQTMGKRDIVFGTDLKADRVISKAKALAKRIVKPTASNWRARGDQRRLYWFEEAKKQMPYRICVPDSWDGESEMTMVLFLHGGWNDESSYLDQNDKQLVKIANKYGVLLVSPMGADGAFGNFLRLPATFGHEEEMLEIMNESAGRVKENYRSEQDVINVIELILAEYPVNRSAMYLMGHSMGAGGTWYIGAKYADYWHGLLPISGPFTMKRDYPWERLKHKPIYMTEGLRAGASLSGSRALYDFAKNEINLNITYKEVDGDHGSMFPMVLENCFKFITKPTAHITSPATDSLLLYMAEREEASFPDIDITVEVTTHEGNVGQVKFYDGGSLFDSKTAAPFESVLTNPSATQHTLRVFVSDENGKTGQATCSISCLVAPQVYNFSQKFKGGDNVPQGWYVSTGKTKRVGSLNYYSEGPRVLHFSNASLSFVYGLLVQSDQNKARAAWAKFGTSDAASRLTLHAGNYTLSYKICNWNQPEFKPVTICIERRDGQEIASQTYTPNVNIGGALGNRNSTVEQQTLEFDISETDDYVIAIYADDTVNSDFVLGQLILTANSYSSTGIDNMMMSSEEKSGDLYDLQGRKMPASSYLQRGIYIRNGKKTLMK